jgi:hypothetical protein
VLFHSPHPTRNLIPEIKFDILFSLFPYKYGDLIVRVGETRNAYKILIGKPEGKRSFRRHRCRYEDNIRMDLTEIVQEGECWIHMALNRD